MPSVECILVPAGSGSCAAVPVHYWSWHDWVDDATGPEPDSRTGCLRLPDEGGLPNHHRPGDHVERALASGSERDEQRVHRKDLKVEG